MTADTVFSICRRFTLWRALSLMLSFTLRQKESMKKPEFRRNSTATRRRIA